LILLGQSLGSAPAVHLAINRSFQDIRAVMLISPISSGIKLVSPNLDIDDLEKIDVFCNIKKIADVACPIFVVHGQKDEVIPIQQSIDLARHMKNAYEWHPRHGDHSNILTNYRTKFIQKCKFFFEYLSFFSKQKNTNSDKFLTQFSFNAGKKRNSKYFNHIQKTPIHYEENYIFSVFEKGCLSIDSKVDRPSEFQEKLKYYEETSNNKFTNSIFDQSNITNNKIRLSNQSHYVDYPFDLNEIERNQSSLVNKQFSISQEYFDERDSREGNILIFNSDQEIKEQYMKLTKN
jgi:hypothetical protein